WSAGVLEYWSNGVLAASRPRLFLTPSLPHSITPSLQRSILIMPSIPIIMPQLGESIAEATIVNLLVKIGDQVQTNQDIIEVETSKATMNVASPCPGHAEKLTVKLN